MSEWIKHDGSGYPVPRGTVVDYIMRDGNVGHVKIMCTASSVDGVEEFGRSTWFWARQQKFDWYISMCYQDVIAYRICDDGSKAETERRESRIASFRKLTEINPLDVRKVPEKKKVDV